MPTTNKLPEDDQTILSLLRVASQQSQIRKMVEDNHDHNRWWPLHIADPRIRMTVAGWSSRVSYAMVSTYREIVDRVADIGWDKLTQLTDAQLYDTIGSLGLTRSRIAYLRSLQKYLETRPLEDILTNDATTEIGDFAANVHGASYKIAQCATLYARGYHCGIIPVDSGMVTKLAPCLGLELPKGVIAHEHMRLYLQNIAIRHATQIKRFAKDFNITTPKDAPPTWLTHLILIYFKRAFLNRPDLRVCSRRPVCVTVIDCACPR